jgi:Type II secretion system (T2SS), protein M subtype b
MSIAAWPAWKKGIAAVLFVLVAADLVLVLLLWQIGREGPRAMRARMVRVGEQAKLLRADVERGDKIRASLPLAGKQCDDFYRKAFFDSSTGYSQIESDLNVVSKNASVQMSGLKFGQKEVKGRGVTEVSVSTKVNADYPSVIRFINGLERSRGFYLLDNLHLVAAKDGTVELDLQMHTYFRT